MNNDKFELLQKVYENIQNEMAVRLFCKDADYIAYRLLKSEHDIPNFYIFVMEFNNNKLIDTYMIPDDIDDEEYLVFINHKLWKNKEIKRVCYYNELESIFIDLSRENKPIISKELFCEIVNTILKHHEDMDKLGDLIDAISDGYSCPSIGGNLVDTVIDLLNVGCQIKDEDLLGWWFWEDVDKIITVDGVDIDVSTPESLYNYITRFNRHD